MDGAVIVVKILPDEGPKGTGLGLQSHDGRMRKRLGRRNANKNE